MTQTALEIVDSSLKYSLWAFLVVLILALALIFAFRRRAGRGSMLRSAFRATILSLVVAALVFVVAAFTPLSPVKNFAAVRTTGDQTPLRLTSLIYERSYEGFSLQGEVWNQSPGTMSGVQARLNIWGQDGAVLDQVTASVEPADLAPKQSGAFTVQYLKNSPFLYGYDVSFITADGKVIPYVKGFDVH